MFLNATTQSGATTELPASVPDDVTSFPNTTNKKSDFDCFMARVVIDVFLVGIICMVGFVGNAISLMVLRRDPDKNNTANWLLQALACTDTLYLICSVPAKILPGIDAFTDWIPSKVNLYSIFIKFEVFTHVISVWLIVLITVDRYIAICEPLQSHSIRTLRCVKLSFAAVVMGAVLFVAFYFYSYKVIAYFNLSITFQAIFDILYVTLNLILTSVGPLLILIVLNVLIMKSLRKMSRKRQARRGSTHDKDNASVMVVVVVCVFIVCKIPDVGFLCYYLALVLMRHSWPNMTFCYWFISTQVLLTLNSAINFFIYCLVGKKFRRILHRMCCGESISTN